MLKSLLVLADWHYPTWLLIGWQHCCQPIRDHVRKWPTISFLTWQSISSIYVAEIFTQEENWNVHCTFFIIIIILKHSFHHLEWKELCNSYNCEHFLHNKKRHCFDLILRYIISFNFIITHGLWNLTRHGIGSFWLLPNIKPLLMFTVT